MTVAISGLLTPCAVHAAPSATQGLTKYLDVGLPNRDASHGIGAPNPGLPSDSAQTGRLVRQARAQGLSPRRYGALLYTYWLQRSTEAAHIELSRWNPRAGVNANLQNLVRSYRYYEDLQIGHRELRWAGMAGQVGADFGGGLLDLELAGQIYQLANLQPAVAEVVRQANSAGGPALANRLPSGLRALATVGKTISAADISAVIGQILVMQKNIFGDLMPVHTAYVQGGLPAVHELVNTGLYPTDIGTAFDDIASGDSSRITAANGRLLRREQSEVVGRQWDSTRHYKAPIGEALTYASTIVGSPSVAGVSPMRAYRPLDISTEVNGRTVTLTAPLPSWNWSVFPARWAYINSELLPKYAYQAQYRWKQLVSYMSTPYEQQLQQHRVLFNLAPLISSMANETKVTVK
ncbi:hypothetical protein GOEFS_054_00170 [Gordonia effusa NBRC 100432]|uniref:Uncharacterized protein n=1 Tax=Gordonia effusa NBRC 100432 TaxID=1077974 RepID=H0R003_9ACTN|nr:hypothetical protein [Gordonia effusa]GAB18404.1 hypothetical protein GOEFS_054_00170 [Gordonia effusa NBRC 100432]